MERKSLLWAGTGSTLAAAVATAGAIYWRRRRGTPVGEGPTDEELLGEEWANFDALGNVIRQLENVKQHSTDPFLTGGATALLKWARRQYARTDSRIDKLNERVKEAAAAADQAAE